MEEQREESEFVGDCRQSMEEEVAGKGLGLSSKTQTLDANTVEVLDSVSDEKQVKVDVDATNEPETEISKMECQEEDAGTVEVKPVDEIKGSEICDHVQRVSKTVKLVEVETNDEIAKSQVNAGNESGDSIIYTNQKARNDLQNSMKRGVNMKTIPTDLIIEIFSRLPAKSVGRFRSLSKLWCSMLSRADFIEVFQSRSCARPRLLFAVERKGVWRFFSSPQSSSSPVVDADFHTKLSEDVSRFTCSYAFGLFYFRDMWIARHGTFYMVCNPITGQYVTLPKVYMYRKSRGFLGFDPTEKKFKVLAEAHPFCSQRDHHEVLTLGTGEISWRKKKIDCPHYDHSMCEGICIDGVLYYLVLNVRDLPVSIVRFDWRSEEFRFVVAECFADPKTTKLINYKGKLGGIECSYGEAGGRFTLELRMCVLEDVERHEWSTHVYTLPENKLIDDPSNVSIAGVTATGEIVLAMDYTCKPYYVFYFNPERNTLQSVEIQGFGADLEALEYRGRVHAFVDHVEHLDVEDFKHSRVKHQCSTCEGHFHVDDSKPLESSIFANQVKQECSNCEEQEKRESQ